MNKLYATGDILLFHHVGNTHTYFLIAEANTHTDYYGTVIVDSTDSYKCGEYLNISRQALDSYAVKVA
jgi:hypothetical protein